jgi:hypothetical protein
MVLTMIEYLAPDAGLLLLCFVLKHCGLIEMEFYVPRWLSRWLESSVEDLPDWERL